MHKELIGKGELTKDEQEMKVTDDRIGILGDFIGKALKNYDNFNKKMPSVIVIYRDGVGGPSMQ